MPKHHNLDKLLYGVDEAAEVLAIGRTRVYELMNDGSISYVKIGASRRIPAAALAAFVESLVGDAA
jgi:excisionase family DNA binding protein